MAVAPTGSLSKPLYNLQTLIASSATFQTWVGATGDAEAKLAAARARIYLAAKPGGSAVRPFAVVGQGDEREWPGLAGGARNHFGDSGSLLVSFEADVAEEDQDDDADAEMAFLNPVGGVIDDILQLSASGGYLAVTGITLSDGPGRSDPRERDSLGDAYWILFQVRWGVESIG